MLTSGLLDVNNHELTHQGCPRAQESGAQRICSMQSVGAAGGSPIHTARRHFRSCSDGVNGDIHTQLAKTSNMCACYLPRASARSATSSMVMTACGWRRMGAARTTGPGPRDVSRPFRVGQVSDCGSRRGTRVGDGGTWHRRFMFCAGSAEGPSTTVGGEGGPAVHASKARRQGLVERRVRSARTVP